MSIASRFSRFVKRFSKNARGDVALMFGLAAVPMLLAGGIAIDYSNGLRAKATLQAAVDNAALAAGYDTDMSDADMLALVTQYLNSNNANAKLTSVDAISVQKVGNDGLKVSAAGTVKTYLMGIVGVNTMDIKAESFIKNSYGNLEVTLVLDNTWSMSSAGKMAALKNAAHTLVDKLHDNKGPSADLQIGLVPFAQYVNIGMSRRNALWSNVPADWDETINYNGYWYRPVIRTYNCRMEQRNGVRDGVPYTYQARVCDYDYGARVWHPGGSWVKHHKWNGCVGSRNYPLNVQDTAPGSQIPGLLDTSCSREFTTLTASKNTIKNEIDNMTASGNQTYIPAGLMWGWRLLSSDVPIADGVSKAKMKSDNYTKAIVLMTDGENTVSPSYPAHGVGNGTDADKLTKELCTNIKNDGATAKEKIRVYTVTFAVTDPATKKMMRECATNDSYYFDASDSAALSAAFEKIGKSLVTLFISK
jgi:Flp pilus assembly protein TadG